MANTLIMSVRTFLTMAVSLYSSRIVLSQLGVVDYGIYFAVAGITVVLSLLNSALSISTQRFLSFEFGQHDTDRLRAVFSASLQIHFLIAIVTVIVCETLGLWFLDAHMVIPEARMDAARLAFHFAVLSTALTIVLVPYNASLVASERFGAYAIFDGLHAFLRLGVAFLLMLGNGDLLEMFAGLMFGVTFSVAAGKMIYCRWQLGFSRYRVCRDRRILSRMTGFAGWSLLGAASLMLNIQGIGILLNMFFGPIANAAQNIAVQVNNATSTLAVNLQITSSPQIVRAYAANDMERFHRLIEHSAKLSFLLMLVLTAPMVAGMDAILALWLETVPPQAAAIARLLLLTAAVNSFSYPLLSAAQASGTIRLYQTIISGLGLSVIPLGYIAFSRGADLLVIFQLMLVVSMVMLAVRLVLLRGLVDLNIGRFLRVVILPSACIAAIAFATGWATGTLLPTTQMAEIAGAVVIGSVTLAAAYRFGLTAGERNEINAIFGSRFKSIGGLA
ncbi:MAG: hypothetical protein CML30_12190 [Rhizobiales bacterium]|nr:hypothetical protein [Hyphomicrobiales bacterium]